MAKEKTKDNIFRKLFSDKDLFKMFLDDFIDRDWVFEIDKDDIEVLPTEYIDLIGANRENDIVYKIKLDDEEAFVFIMLEHQSKTDFLMPFRLLEYMTRLWRVYIDENADESENKPFKLPPILPIVFYDGKGNWTAEIEFKDKVKHYESFKQHIPNFSYKPIVLNSITIEELIEKGNAISLILAMDKIKTVEDLKVIKQLKEEYWEALKESLKHSNILENVALAIKHLLLKVNVPEDEIEEVLKVFKEGKVRDMFQMIEEYDVQKVRSEEREKAKKERDIEIAQKMLRKGIGVPDIIDITGLDKEKIEEIKKEIEQ
ncbi:Rpn family recombination-promoting nuclease/putative transposase [Fuchsiella alkaliacetigena]|uniref:Rpn family recombination-promoting nuclease/putative transposase n=1 Tax=Fuchsiella alkaliacetigena TaxID=957042 RepID=UPI002009DC82|nr:Rpn family recombination-promoting nuclease/putative transposase [Fuchsiella alkaliacetigena]MCK8825866.1 Rpn family recombination-promoting nuclease/putative transposase [Fuchsiella alkaliacetigena]